ncbi:MAG TPA: M1 family metallopeptidase [Actinophytocola sp.]|uniref:M1 family metallopeptidase n=1 Tax=Actinophytocola sp. TaxID=1872138 RepID=UPI002DB7C94C|nr:M1 family metallopeptidase [Actinophytocola sp.]HEU5471997.1 M1 family metallopeptidase [Actinophytocola sp.]
MRTLSRLTLTCTSAALATVLLATSASAAPGAPGLDDPYYPLDGNGGYDVSHYDIRLTYQPSGDLLSGTTTILATATQDLDRFNLDFLLRVSSVRVNNAPARIASHQDGELAVVPSRPVPRGGAMTIVVRYADVPSNPNYTLYGFNLWTRTPTGALASNAPQTAAWWFPSNNTMTDKATFDVSVAAPDGVEVLSNGNLVSRQKQIDGWTRWNWRSTKPQVTYAVLLAVGQFDDLRFASTPGGMPLITAYANNLGELAGAARASVERTPEIVEFEESVFGPYPFDAQGGIVVGLNELGFALENATRPVYDAVFFNQGSNTYVVAHELSHMWFANSVSAHSWQDVWLHEGFATYASYLWSDYLGEGTAAELAQFRYDVMPAAASWWQVLPGDPGVPFQFHPAVYHRGAMTLQALRTAVGDEAFLQILQSWTATHRYGDATTAEFIALAEQVSGQQLDELFSTWLFTRGKPAVGPNGAVAARLAPATEPKSYRKISETYELMARAHG